MDHNAAARDGDVDKHAQLDSNQPAASRQHGDAHSDFDGNSDQHRDPNQHADCDPDGQRHCDDLQHTYGHADPIRYTCADQYSLNDAHSF